MKWTSWELYSGHHCVRHPHGRKASGRYVYSDHNRHGGISKPFITPTGKRAREMVQPLVFVLARECLGIPPLIACLRTSSYLLHSTHIILNARTLWKLGNYTIRLGSRTGSVYTGNFVG